MVLQVPWGHGQLALSPCSGSEVRVLLFNATGDRDTAALLKLLVVRFGGHRGGHCARVLCRFWDLLCCGCREPRGGAGTLSVCLSVQPSCCPGLYPTSTAPCRGVTVLGVGRDLDHPL